MRKLGLSDIIQGIVRVALASTVGAGAYACDEVGSDTPLTFDAGSDAKADASADAGDPSFADEGSFACAAPLPNIVGNLSPVTPVDYVELRTQALIANDDGGAIGAPTASATHGTACATATNHDACTTALGALAIASAVDGWGLDDNAIGPGNVGTRPRQLLVYTRGDEVGALRTPTAVTQFLGSIDSIEEARLVLATHSQPLVCTTAPRKSGWRMNADGSWEVLVVGATCGSLISYRTRYNVSKTGVVSEVAKDTSLTNGAVCGRRPEGLRASDGRAGAPLDLAAHFVLAAHLEAASVIAFRRLELELRRFGAPESFAVRARRSRADEIGHARETARVARRLGGVMPAVEIAPMRLRDLFAFALENAVEGAVRETYGALVAAFQAERASPELRPMLRRIARDEARHAELAHDIDRWVQPKLTADERARLATARAEALDDLRAATAREPNESVVRVAGVPNAAEACVLLDGMTRENPRGGLAARGSFRELDALDELRRVDLGGVVGLRDARKRGAPTRRRLARCAGNVVRLAAYREDSRRARARGARDERKARGERARSLVEDRHMRRRRALCVRGEERRKRRRRQAARLAVARACEAAVDVTLGVVPAGHEREVRTIGDERRNEPSISSADARHRRKQRRDVHVEPLKHRLDGVRGRGIARRALVRARAEACVERRLGATVVTDGVGCTHVAARASVCDLEQVLHARVRTGRRVGPERERNGARSVAIEQRASPPLWDAADDAVGQDLEGAIDALRLAMEPHVLARAVGADEDRLAHRIAERRDRRLLGVDELDQRHGVAQRERRRR